MEWDVKSMVADCDLRDLAPWLGIKTRRAGSTTFIECLSGTHHETQIDHCEAKRGGCRCYSCHVKYQTGMSDPSDDWNDIIDVIRQFKRNRSEDDSFQNACETLAEFLGNRDRYLINGTGQKRKEFPYTVEELKAAGFSIQARPVMRELFEKDEQFLSSLVLDKVTETITNLKKIIEVSWDPEVTDEAVSRLQASAKLYERLTGKKTVRKLF